MPAPSKNYTLIADSSVDSDSPLDVTLLTAIRDNLIHLEEWLGDSHTAAKNHQHNGTDSARVNDSDITKTGGVLLFDDFLLDSIVGWGTVNGGTITFQTADNGIIRCQRNAVSGWCGIGQTYKPFRLSSNEITFEARLRIGSGSAAPNNAECGVFESLTIPNNNSVKFLRDTSTGNYDAICQSAGVSTTVDTGVLMSSTAFQKLKIVGTTSQVKFYIDDVLKTTITTNIPTVNLGVSTQVNSDGASNKYIDIDYVLCTMGARL